MHSIHVRNLDAAVVAALEERARRHQRSLEGEVRAILAEAAKAAADVPTEGRRLRLHTVSVGGESTWSRDDIYADTSPDEPGAR
jgi:plasmid stability protein